MNELRHGVKLKKTDHTKTPIEYALTPYEMLMDDIRSRRYKLNKVMVDGDLPHKVKKDAHDIILEFIRSRPPLKPVSIGLAPNCLLTRLPNTVELMHSGWNSLKQSKKLNIWKDLQSYQMVKKASQSVNKLFSYWDIFG